MPDKNPVLNIGPQRSRFARPDYSMLARGMEKFGQGIGRGLKWLGRDPKDMSLAELFAWQQDTGRAPWLNRRGY